MAKRLSIRPLSRLRSLLIGFCCWRSQSRLAGNRIRFPPNVAVLDFTVRDAGHTGPGQLSVGDLFQIELQRLGMVTLDRDSIHTVLAEQRLAAETDRRGLP